MSYTFKSLFDKLNPSIVYGGDLNMKSNNISANDKQFYKELSQRLRIERLMNNLTQEEMAEIMDVSPRHYGRYESGRYPIPFDKISVLLESGLDCYYIVTGER